MSTVQIIFDKPHTDSKTGVIVEKVTFKDCSYIKDAYGVDIWFDDCVHTYPWHKIAHLKVWPAK